MNHEKQKKQKDVPVEELSEIDFSLLSANELYELLHALAEANGINPEDALYVGLDTGYNDPLISGFGNRTTTWAFTDAKYHEAATNDTKHGSHSEKSPIFYAENGSLEPTVIILNGTMFDSALGQARPDDEDWTDSIHTDLEYRLKPGFQFDEAVVAALRITP